MKIQRPTSSSISCSKLFLGSGRQQQYHPLVKSCGVAKFLLLGLGLLMLLQAEQNVLRRVLYQANESLQQHDNDQQQDGHISLASPMINAHANNAKARARHNTFSACLVLQNEHENQYLTEWLAYHWHVLPLRRLIIWKDPLSQTNPDTILNKWSDKMDITVWDHPGQIYPVGHPHHHKNVADMQDIDHHERLQARNARQDVFFGMCLRTLKREQRRWTLLSHTDEYTLINPRVRNITDPLHDNLVRVVDTFDSNLTLTIPSQQEAGSVLKWLQTTQTYSSLSSSSSEHILSQPCIPLTWKQFGTREGGEEEAVVTGMDKTTTSTTQFGNTTLVHTLQTTPQDYLTLRWQYWGRKDEYQHGNANTNTNTDKTRKQLLDLTRIPASQLHWKVDAHRPILDTDLCPIHTVSERDTLFVVHHYAGTLERVYYGDQRHHHHNVDTAETTNNDNNNAPHHSTVATITINDRNDKPLNKEERIHQDVIHTAYWEGNTIPQWLDGFVDSVGGVNEATRLLDGVGHLQE